MGMALASKQGEGENMTTEPWFPDRDRVCVDTILLLAAQGKTKEAWALELKREARIDWELEQARDGREQRKEV